MREILYINGQRIDMSSSGVTLTLKSNLFGEFGKITSGYSQTIKVPKTVTNTTIFGIPEITTKDNEVVRKRLPAKLYRDGILLIDGIAILLTSTKDSYEFALTFGVVSFLDAVKDGGDLNELPDNGEYVIWNEYSLSTGGEYRITEYNPAYGFADYDNGVNDVSKCQNTPLVSIEWLLAKIESTFGFNFSFGDGRREVLEDKYILLTEKNGSKEAISAFEGSYDVKGHTYVNRLSGECIVPKKIHGNNNIDINGYRIVFNQSVSYFLMTFSLSFYSGDLSGMSLQVLVNDVEIQRTYTFDTRLDYMFSLEGGTMKVGDTIAFRLKGYESVGSPSIIAGVLQMKCNYIWEDGMEPSDLTYPDSYGIVKNLPDIKITDFIKIVGVLTGTFPIVNHGDVDVLRMVSVEDLIANKSSAVDWSDKWNGEFNSIGYTFLEAQSNKIIWESDEEVVSSGFPYKGGIPVADETLEVSVELMELPLSASRGNSVGQYILKDDGSVEDGDVTERIMTVKDGIAIYDSTLWPQRLIDGALRGYRDIVRQPVVVKGTFRLDVLDIKFLNYVVPVYLRQTGKYYGIVQIQYKGDVSEVELIEL